MMGKEVSIRSDFFLRRSKIKKKGNNKLLNNKDIDVDGKMKIHTTILEGKEKRRSEFKSFRIFKATIM